MAKRIYLKLGSPIQLQNSIKATSVTLTIYDENGRLEESSSYLSVMPESLSRALHRWQKYITPTTKDNDNQVRRIKLTPARETQEETGDINFQEIANDFKKNLNQWLNADNWLNEDGDRDRKIPDALAKYFQFKEEIQIFIQTEDRKLRGLPWQEADILEQFFRSHPDTELSISATDFTRPDQNQTLLTDARIRILAIFGDTKLGLQEEQELISNLGKYGALIETLEQPNRLTLEQKLQDPKGWHILFFAGHSQSDRHGKIGKIWINDDENLNISELTKFMEKLIDDKLQLAIFNSCDGLGLANQLTSLNLPYCIVMREEVESAFARKLLKHLLIAFTLKEKSIFASMRFARERLREEFDEVYKHPGKSWLPAIVANPEARSLTWDSMFTERRLDRKWEFLLVTVFIIAITALPLSISLEFGADSLTLYAELYPHLIIYASIFLGASLYSLYRAICLIREKTKIFWGFTLAIFLFSMIGVSMELNSSPITLFEIKPLAEITNLNSQETISKQSIENSIHNLINLSRKNSNYKDDSEYQRLTKDLYASLEYKQWENQKQFSISRLFYAFHDFSMFFCAFEMLALLIQNLANPSSVFKKHKYVAYLILCCTGLLFWVPFYSYYRITIKNLLFNQDLSLSNLAGFINIVILTLLIMILRVISTQFKINSKKYDFSATLIIIFSSLTFIHQFGGIYIIQNMFGIDAHSLYITWISSIFFSLLIISVVDFLIENKIID